MAGKFCWDEVWKNDINNHRKIRIKKCIYKLENFSLNGVDFSKCSNIADIGCGVGTISEILLSKNKQLKIDAYDKSKVSFELMTDFLVNNSQFKFFEIDLSSESIDSARKYDLIVSFGVLDHIMHPEYFIANISNNMLNNGILLLTFPYKYSIFVLQRKFLQLIKKWPYGYQLEYDLNSIRKLFNKNKKLEIVNHFIVPCDGGLGLLSLLDRFFYKIFRKGRYIFAQLRKI
jgi:SAM-dependent methyltransferase